MRMTLTKTSLKIKCVRELLEQLNKGMAIRKTDWLDTCFTFVGADGLLYSSNRHNGVNEFQLTQNEFLPLAEEFDRIEVYEIKWLAFDNVPWNLNIEFCVKPATDNRSLLYCEDKQSNIRRVSMLSDYRWVMNLYHTKTSNIWIAYDYQTFKDGYKGGVRFLFMDGSISEFIDIKPDRSLDFFEDNPIMFWQPLAV